MMATLISGLTSASLSVLGSIMTKKLFETIIRKVFVAVLKYVVKSTENTVDDEAVKPIIKALEK